MGHANQVLVKILIDSGSTHCFIDITLAHALQLPMAKLMVTVANRGQLQCSAVSPEVRVQLGELVFSSDLFLISLGDFGVVLGVNWLSTLGPISWDFKHMTMAFDKEGRSIHLQGMSKGSKAHLSTFSLSLSCDEKCGLQLLLEKYDDIFALPAGLPPDISCTQKIILSQDTDPVVVRPYRYPHVQKDEIERQCAEMLVRGIICPSTHPFSAPVLLVRKAENSWHFCVDYRALNARTVNDKFPILVIDKLLEELTRAR